MAVRTEYQGIGVESQSEVPARHPRWGYDEKRMSALKGGSLLMLVDGTFVVVCDSCDFNGLTGYEPYVKPEGEYKSILKQADSIMSHANGIHHPNKANRRTSMYEDETIRVAIRVWLKWRNTGVRNWTKAACEELDQRGVKPFRGEHWTNGSLGSLVRTYAKRDKFKNTRAASMNDADQEKLAELARNAAAREGNGANSVAANVRITQSPHKHTPINFNKIIADKEAAREEQRRQEEEPVVTGMGTNSDPILNFVGVGAKPEPPVKTLLGDGPSTSPASRKKDPLPVLPVLEQSDFVFIIDLPTGDPMFTYKGRLMVGKPVKGVEV